MWVGIVSLFPDMFDALRDYGVVGRAIDEGRLQLHCWNPREFTEDRHRTVDDRPYGGGPGMVMKIAPLQQAISSAKQAAPGTPTVVYLSPQGRRLTHQGVTELGQIDPLVLVCGRYEGIDERLIAQCVDAEWSIGDFVLSGGELPAMVLIDALARQMPGVLGHEDSAAEDSFADGLLDCPHYTRPEVFDGQAVPAVLLSGDHERIRQWRLQQSLGRTWQRRPDLLAQRTLSAEEQALLNEFIEHCKPQNHTDE